MVRPADSFSRRFAVFCGVLSMIMAAVLIIDMARYSIAGDAANKAVAFLCFVIATFSAVVLTMPRFAQTVLRIGQSLIGRVVLFFPAALWLVFGWLFVLFRFDPETGLLFRAIPVALGLIAGLLFTSLYVRVFVLPGSVFRLEAVSPAEPAMPERDTGGSLRKVAQFVCLIAVSYGLVKLTQAAPILGFMGDLMPFVVFGAGCIWIISHRSAPVSVSAPPDLPAGQGAPDLQNPVFLADLRRQEDFAAQAARGFKKAQERAS